jgi:hypothetical protein
MLDKSQERIIGWYIDRLYFPFELWGNFQISFSRLLILLAMKDAVPFCSDRSYRVHLAHILSILRLLIVTASVTKLK